jgi:hypothetical protein
MKRAGMILAVLLLLGVAARADEFHLKDGTTIIGTIVGYQGNSFRVKTSYGFALVDRNAIASITVSKPGKSAGTKEKTRAPESFNRAAKTGASAATAREKSAEPAHSGSVEVARKSAPEKLAKSIPTAKPLGAAAETATAPAKITARAQETQPQAVAAQSSTAPAAAPAPVAIPVRDEVQGNLYINETYGFRMYKPPDWDVIQGARAALPGAITALGTSDQSTYLIIGLDPASGALQTHVASINERLANLFDNFRALHAAQVVVAGSPAYEYQFQGMANNQQWSGTVVLLDRGQNFFTIFGVTAANSDLVQIQQNVISRTIASLQFTTP